NVLFMFWSSNMLVSRFKKIILISLLTIVAGCVSVGWEQLTLSKSTFENQYPQIKKIATEEAANYGFSDLTSEVKPSQFNDYKGRLFFQLETTNGTDQLFVDFSPDPQGVAVKVHGAGTRGDADAAAQAISARLKKL
ncbi:MAG: hypothetical protein LC677_14985, partial [Halomonas sp.]|nr:hypothetical protein [Halomonas sp.]